MCCTTHRIIDAALDIAARPGFAAADVRRIEVALGARQAAMAGHRWPRDPLEAKYSVEFAVPGALAAGAAGFAQLTLDFVASPAVVRLMEATHIALRHETDRDDPVFTPADRVMARMADGTVIDSGEVSHAHGHARLPVSPAEARRKFIDCARHGGCADVDALHDLLDGFGAIADLRSLAIQAAPPGGHCLSASP